MTGTDFDLGEQSSEQSGTQSDIDRLIDQTEDDGGEQSDPTGQETPSQATQDGEQRDDKADASQQGDSGQREGQPQGERGQTQEGQGNTGAQDLTLRDGSVIKGGATRRIYERGLQNERLAPQVNQITQERDQLRSQVQAYENAFATAKNSGLNPQESAWAHQIVAAFKQDPVKTLQHLLAQTKAAGYNTEQIAQGVDANALKQMLQNEIGPIRQSWEQQQQQEQTARQAEQMYSQFLQSYEAADKHQDEIAQLMENGLSPDAAYYALRSAYLERGLDFNLSLQENAQRRATQQGASQQKQQPVPHGRGNAVTNAPQQHTPPMASENDTWDAIIRGAM